MSPWGQMKVIKEPRLSLRGIKFSRALRNVTRFPRLLMIKSAKASGSRHTGPSSADTPQAPASNAVANQVWAKIWYFDVICDLHQPAKKPTGFKQQSVWYLPLRSKRNKKTARTLALAVTKAYIRINFIQQYTLIRLSKKYSWQCLNNQD